MATPFTFFRKYAGGLMVVMVILSMMLFTMDSIFSDTSMNLWLLGMLIGSAAFGIAGIGSGRWIQWGIGGGILGTVLGLVLPGFAGGGGIPSAVGTFDEEALYDLGARRTVANQFISQVNPRFRFGFGQQNANLDLIFGRLMQAEADELGVAIDSDGISEYLSVVGQGLTKEKYLEIRNSLSYQGKALDDEQFQKILGNEIRSRMAYELLQAGSTAMPAEPDTYWQYFRRLRVRQQIEVASLDVDQFLDQVGEPTDAEVEKLFEEYKGYFPNNKEPGSPGFALPNRANITYLELDAQSVEDSLDPVTEAEIKKYYEDNKETPLIRSIVIPDEEPAEGEDKEEGGSDNDSDSAEGKKEAAGETAEEKAEKPEADKPEVKKPEGEKSDSDAAGAKAAEEKPAKPEAATYEAGTKEAKQASEPAESKVESSPEEPAEKKEEVKEQSAKKPVFPQDETAEPEAEKPQEEAAESAKTDEAVQADTPGEKAEQEPPAGGLTIPDAPEADGKEEEPEYEYRELDEELTEQIRELIMADRVSEEMASRVKSAKGEMELLARKYGEKRLETIESDPNRYGATGPDEIVQERLKELRLSLADFYDDMNADLKKIGNKYGFAYVETGLIGGQELQSSEDFTIGKATEPSANPMMQFQAPPVVNTIYSGLSLDEQNNAGLMFQVGEGVRTGSATGESQRRFLYWVSDISPQHIPELSEPGVRESVVTAWKSMKAREIVEKRGEELAEKVKAALGEEGDDKQNLVAALDGETVTGKDDGVPLARRVSMPFSWMRVTQAPQMGFQMPVAEQSIITFEQDGGAPLDMIGGEFMKTIFEDMSDEDVQVVPDFDFSTYHVVHVINRFPTPEIGEEGLREDFAKQSQQNGFRSGGFGDHPIVPVISRDLIRPASGKWQRSIFEKYEIDLNGEG